MRPFILSALLLAAATPVLAQMPHDTRDEHHDDRGGDHHDNGGGDHHDNGGGDHRDNGGGDHRDNRDQGQRPDDHGYRPDDRGGYHADDRGDRGGGDHRDFHDDRRSYGDGDRYARFHAEPYFHPHGYAYRYYGVGAFLPQVYFDTRYYIGQPDYYRLPPAYAGTRWVRVGPDALLIRNYDRRVVRIIRGLFY
jgi:Ni/Co efflux regulator RcnB